MIDIERFEIEVHLMEGIIMARQVLGEKVITRRQMFDYIESIYPHPTIGKQKVGVEFSNMMESAANGIVGAHFVYDKHPSGKRKNVRVELT